MDKGIVVLNIGAEAVVLAKLKNSHLKMLKLTIVFRAASSLSPTSLRSAWPT
jgi:hypothetical protein